jgi:hypothetical protein
MRRATESRRHGEVEQPDVVWWAKIRNSRGQEGWTREVDHFFQTITEKGATIDSGTIHRVGKVEPTPNRTAQPVVSTGRGNKGDDHRQVIARRLPAPASLGTLPRMRPTVRSAFAIVEADLSRLR